MIEIPLGVKYEGRDSEQNVVLTRVVEHLVDAFYGPSDLQFKDPLGMFPTPQPFGKLEAYGLRCAQYCASKEFDARVFLKSPNSRGRGSLLHEIKPADVAGREGLYLPMAPLIA